MNSGDSNNTRFQFSYSGGKYGYKDASGNHVNFRNPTGTATSAQVLSGYTFSNANGDGLTGSITSRSASSATIASAVTYYAGYYANNWTVTPSSTTYKLCIDVVYYISSNPYYRYTKIYYNITGNNIAGPYTDSRSENYINVYTKSSYLYAKNSVNGFCAGGSSSTNLFAGGYNASTAPEVIIGNQYNHSNGIFICIPT